MDLNPSDSTHNNIHKETCYRRQKRSELSIIVHLIEKSTKKIFCKFSLQHRLHFEKCFQAIPR